MSVEKFLLFKKRLQLRIELVMSMNTSSSFNLFHCTEVALFPGQVRQLGVAAGLLDLGAKVRAYDPAGMEQAKKELPDITYCEDPYAVARDADALVIVTEWRQFRALDLKRLKREMATPVMVDLRNIYRRDEMEELGFTYESVGRGAV